MKPPINLMFGMLRVIIYIVKVMSSSTFCFVFKILYWFLFKTCIISEANRFKKKILN